MGIFFEFIKSDVGVGLAWLCTVGSVVFAILTKRENRSLKIKVEKFDQRNYKDNGHDTVSQNGLNNIYTKHSSGNVDIDIEDIKS